MTISGTTRGPLKIFHTQLCLSVQLSIYIAVLKRILQVQTDSDLSYPRCLAVVGDACRFAGGGHCVSFSEAEMDVGEECSGRRLVPNHSYMGTTVCRQLNKQKDSIGEHKKQGTTKDHKLKKRNKTSNLVVLWGAATHFGCYCAF